MHAILQSKKLQLAFYLGFFLFKVAHVEDYDYGGGQAVKPPYLPSMFLSNFHTPPTHYLKINGKTEPNQDIIIICSLALDRETALCTFLLIHRFVPVCLGKAIQVDSQSSYMLKRIIVISASLNSFVWLHRIFSP